MKGLRRSDQLEAIGRVVSYTVVYFTQVATLTGPFSWGRFTLGTLVLAVLLLLEARGDEAFRRAAGNTEMWRLVAPMVLVMSVLELSPTKRAKWVRHVRGQERVTRRSGHTEVADVLGAIVDEMGSDE